MSLAALVQLSHWLGDPARNLAIIGEGNTSLRADDETFWVKASGQHLGTIADTGFARARFLPLMELLNGKRAPESQNEVFQECKVDSDSPLKPSIEVTFHAMLLYEFGAQVIAHTHPTAVNQILCSSRAEQFALNRMFPDEVVLCGPQSVFVPYSDPGLPLAFEMRRRAQQYLDVWGEPPKVILLANHGLIVLGQSPTDAMNITAMCVKAAAIFAGACAVGEPVFMTRDDIGHIYRRPDEIYRRKQFM